MPTTIAAVIEMVVLVYLILGLLLALPLAMVGIRRIDPAAESSTIGFRVLVIPSCVILWPWFLVQLLERRRQPPVEKNRHRDHVT